MTQRLRTARLAVGLALALLGISAAPAAAEAGDARAAAAEASLTGTIGIFPVELLDLALSEAEVAQGDPDETVTETLLSIDLPIIGPVPLVSADAVTSTASSNHIRSHASSMLTDVSVNLPVGVLPTVLTLDTIGSSATCHIVDPPTAEVIPPVSATLLGVPIDVELDQDIEVDIGIAQAVLRFEEITLTTDTATAIGVELALDVSILGVATLDLDLTLANSACERGIAQLPTAGSLDPDSGPETGGTEVCVSGTNFVPDHTTVNIGTETVPATEVEVIDDGMTACFISPPHTPGVVDVTVETPGGVSTPPLAFEYIPVGPGQPVALTIDPDSGPEAGGTLITITGANFVVDETSVHIGGITVPASEVNVVSETELQFTTPAHAAGVVDVTVETVSGGESDPPLAFTYLAQPVASTIDPASGPETGGTVVTITGDNFVPGETSVTIGGILVPASEVTVIDAMTLEFETPPHDPGVVDVTVETAGGVSDPPLAFEYIEGGPGQPVTTSIDPSSGPATGGTEVCISGENFVPGETIVHIGTETVPANEVEVNVDGTMACFVTPPHAPGVVDVTVETPGGVSDPPLDFEYLEGGPGQPVATDIEPDSGPETGGTTVVIVGDNFVPDQTSVHIGGNTVPPEQVLVFNATTLSFVTPPHAPGTVDVTVETPDGESDPPLAFEYLEEGGEDQRLPVALEVDSSTVISDGNRVFELGERVEVAPEWLNDSADPVDLNGTGANFTGPAGPTYNLVDAAAGYGMVAAGASASCQETGDCYETEVGPEGAPRPNRHWDTTFDETLSEGTEHTWTLHIGESFVDTSRSHLFYRFIETIFHHGITAGCTATDYCPGGANTRAQMAVFVLRGAEGADFTPLPCTPDAERFDDVPATSNFCPWIEELAERGVVTGCDGDSYCPGAPITRAQMAIFLLRSLEGSDYTPPECSQVFTDVPCPSQFADWIEDLFLRGITEGCTASEYCPAEPLTRGQMGVYLTRTFGLVLYGP